MLSVAAAGRVLISVRDSGVGLRPEQGERIFEAFFTTKPQGTGMGLSISRTGVFHVLDALVRPDGFVAWASDGVASAEEVSRAGGGGSCVGNVWVSGMTQDRGLASSPHESFSGATTYGVPLPTRRP